VRRIIHKTIADISSDFERFHFNRAVARVRELANALDTLSGQGAGEAFVLREGLEALVQLANPMLPHITEELWQVLGHDKMLVESAWPKADPALLVEDNVTLAVQVNGKLRATIEVAKTAAPQDIEAQALAEPNVLRSLDGKTPRKVIVVPGKIVSIVV